MISRISRIASISSADLLVAGGGPAGLATALQAARVGLRVIVIERRNGPIDKACGEGLMPATVRQLQRLGVDIADIPARPFRGIRYLDHRREVDASFRSGSGLGIRRTVLHRALLDAATGARHGPDLAAGPLRQPVRTRAIGRVLLVGDAAGYVDALTGEGLGMAFRAAELLVDCVTADRPDVYDRRWRSVSRRHRALTADCCGPASRRRCDLGSSPSARRGPRCSAVR